MARKPKPRSYSFFKVLFSDDFTRLLRLPPVIGKTYGEILPEKAKLRSSSGETWNVKLERTGDGQNQYCFTQGWAEFAEDSGLEFGEFMMFCFNGKSTFDVSVFGISGCERDILDSNRMVEDSEIDEEEEEEDEAFELSKNWKNYKARGGNLMKNRSNSKASNMEEAAGGSRGHIGSLENHLYFEICLKPYHEYRVNLPKKFIAAAGLKGKESVNVEYVPKGYNQNVVLDHRPDSYRIDMTGGWTKFRKANDLVTGKIYSFEYKPSMDVIQVKDLDKEKN